MPFASTDNGLLYEERGGTLLLRSVFVFAGSTAIVCSFFFVELIRQMGVPDTPAKVGGVVASIAGLAAFWLFGGFCLKHGLFTPQQTAFFDREQRRIIYTTRSPARGTTQAQQAFDDVIDIDIDTDMPDDGEPVFKIRLRRSGSPPIFLFVDGDRGEAEHWLGSVRRVVGLPAPAVE